MHWGDWSAAARPVSYLRDIPGRTVGFKPEMYKRPNGTYEIHDMYHGSGLSSGLRCIAVFATETEAKAWGLIHYSMNPHGAAKGSFVEPSLASPPVPMRVTAALVSISLKDSERKLLLLV